MPSIDNAGGLLSSARGRERTADATAAGDRMASPTDTALSSSGGSVQGRYHSGRTQGHRSSGQQGGAGSGGGSGAGTTAQGTYISTQTAPINIRAMGIKGHHHHAGGEKGVSGNAGENLQAEVDSLKREKEFLEMDLRHAKTLAGSYLQRESSIPVIRRDLCADDARSEVYRLHEKVIAVIADEAERQNIVSHPSSVARSIYRVDLPQYNQLKEQTATIRHLREELRIQRAAVDRAKESIAKMQTEQRETRQIQREEKRARALETSTTRAEIEDQAVRVGWAELSEGIDVLIFVTEDSRSAKARVGARQGCVSSSPIAWYRHLTLSSHFKLNNRLREAEPKIKHIEDYEKEVDKLYHNQLLW